MVQGTDFNVVKWTNGLLVQLILSKEIQDTTVILPVAFSRFYALGGVCYAARRGLEVLSKNLNTIRLACYASDIQGYYPARWDLFFIGF